MVANCMGLSVGTHKHFYHCNKLSKKTEVLSLTLLQQLYNIQCTSELWPGDVSLDFIVAGLESVIQCSTIRKRVFVAPNSM